jgi:trimeric autotransporter adhesin
VSVRRLPIIAVFAVVATVLAAIVIPAAARSQTVNISILSSGPDSSGDPYDLTVVADDANVDGNGNPVLISAMTAHVFDSNGNDVADPAMSYVSGPADDETWAATSPIPDSELPAGTYTVTVDASDSTGESDTGLAAPAPDNSFSFSYTTTMTVVAMPTFVTEGSQSVSFSGSVTGETTGSTGPDPIANATVSIGDTDGNVSTSVTTDSSGNFTASISESQSDTYTFSVTASPTYSAASQDVTVDADQATTTLSLAASPTAVTEGSENVTLSGTVTAMPPGGGTAVPVTGQQLITITDSDGNVNQVVDTDSNGYFSYTADGVTQDDTYTAAIASTNLYTQASSSVTVDASQAVTTLGLNPPSPTTVTLGSTSIVLSGSVMAAPQGGGSAAPVTDQPVTITDSDSIVSTVVDTDSSGNFSTTVNGITQDDTFSFSVPGDTLYSPATNSVTVDASQAPTTISMNAASPATVTQGSTSVTLSGTVTALSPGIADPIPVAGAQVDLNGSPLSGVTTGSDGSFSYQATGVTSTTTFNFSVAGSSLYGPGSGSTTVDATAASTSMSVSPSSTTVTQGSDSVTFSGTVTAGGVAVAGAEVDMNGSPLASPTDNSGAFSATVSGVSANSTYTFSVAGTPLYTAQSASAIVDTVQSPATMTVTASPNNVGIGSQTVSFSGTVLAQPAGGSAVGVADAQVDLNGAAVTGLTTDANGHFTYVIENAAPGDYDFSVGATNLEAGASQDVPVGINQAMTVMKISPSRTNVTQGATTVTFSGTVTGQVPGGSAAPIPSVPIDLAVGSGKAVLATTTSPSGTFTVTVSGITKTADYKFTIATTKNYTEADVPVPITAVRARTDIVAVSASPGRLKYGQKTKLTGTARYLHGKTWTGLADTTVHVRVGNIVLRPVRTNRSGVFSATLYTTHGDAWSTSVSAGTLIGAATAHGSLTVAVPMKVRTFGASLGVLGGVTATGCLQVTVPFYHGPQTSIVIQYARGSRGPWTKLGVIKLRTGAHATAACRSGNESSFSGSIHARLANAYYRANFPASHSFNAAISKAVHAWRYQTKITSFNVSPRTIKGKQAATITGRLWRLGKKREPYGDRTIKFMYNAKGTKFWETFATGKTNSAGYFKQTAAGGGDETFVAVIYAEYPGSRSDLAVTSSGIDLTIVRAKEVE